MLKMGTHHCLNWSELYMKLETAAGLHHCLDTHTVCAVSGLKRTGMQSQEFLSSHCI